MAQLNTSVLSSSLVVISWSFPLTVCLGTISPLSVALSSGSIPSAAEWRGEKQARAGVLSPAALPWKWNALGLLCVSWDLPDRGPLAARCRRSETPQPCQCLQHGSHEAEFVRAALMLLRQPWPSEAPCETSSQCVLQVQNTSWELPPQFKVFLQGQDILQRLETWGRLLRVVCSE